MGIFQFSSLYEDEGIVSGFSVGENIDMAFNFSLIADDEAREKLQVID